MQFSSTSSVGSNILLEVLVCIISDIPVELLHKYSSKYHILVSYCCCII